MVRIDTLYNLSKTNPRVTLQQRFGTISSVEQNLPHFVRWARHVYPNKPAMTNSEILATFEAPACHTDHVVKTDAPLGGTHVDLTNGIGSRETIDWGDGQWDFNIPTVFCFGRYRGSGSGHASGSWGQTAGTGISVAHDAWISRVFPRRDLFVSDTYFMNGGYQESFEISGFRFKGGRMNQNYDTSYESSAVMVFDAGESSIIEKCYAEGFNTSGFTAIKGTSFSIRNCSSFQNGRFGYLILGGNTNIFHLDLVSGDDNGEFLMASLPMGNLVGGGTIRATIVHHETGTRVGRQMGIAWLDGRFTCTITAIHNQNLGVTVPSAFRLNGRIYASQLTVGGLNFSASDGNYTRIIDDVGQNRWWGTGDDIRHKPFSFVWQRELGGVTCTNYPVSRSSGLPAPSTCHIVVIDQLASTPVPCPPSVVKLNGFPVANPPSGGTIDIPIRQGNQPIGNWENGAWMIPNCPDPVPTPTPDPDPVPTPTPDPECVWVVGPWGNWSKCRLFSQSRKRTVVSSIEGCVPKEPKPTTQEFRACVK